MLYRVQSNKDLPEVATALEAAGQKYKFGVLAVHDLKAKLKEKGVEFDRDCLIYEVCNPQQAKKVLEANMEIATALPCRIAIYRQGSGVTLAMLRPAALLDLFQMPGLRAVAEEVEDVMVKMMDEAAR
ncbi:MAG TPA: DUF302 domain-containing protein [Terriglobia bacterium]|nr:DUF302 domain-containing protein [Terriglobia bacterium]